MNIVFTPTAWQHYVEWQKEDKKIIKRINELIKSIDRDGLLNGIGKPEPLKNDLSGFWSRRIDEANRIVYRIANEQIEIVQCKGHYND